MPLLELQTAIKEAWEAVVPTIEPTRRYRFVEKLGYGAGSHRTFHFKDETGSNIKEQGLTRHMIDHEFDARMSLHLPPRSSSLSAGPYREYQALGALVSRLRNSRWIAPRVISWRSEERGDDGVDLELIMRIAVRTKEQS